MTPNNEPTISTSVAEPGYRATSLPPVRQENCKVPRRRGQVHVFGQPFLGKRRLLAEKWTSPRTLQFS